MRKKLCSWILVWTCLLASGPVWGQTRIPGKPWLLGTYAHGSFIIAHSPFMRHLAASHPVGFEVNAQRQTLGEKDWHLLYRLPKVGYSFVYYNYRNPTLGRSFALSTYLNKTLVRTSKGELNYRLGVGIAYLTNTYHQELNHKNSVASSALNATMQTRFEYSYRFAPAFSVLAGLGLNHYSNGATQKPNLGINLPVLSLGVNYHTHPAFSNTQLETLWLERALLTNNRPVFDSSPYLTASTTLGFRQINISDKKKYAVQSLTLAMTKPLNPKSNMLLGLEGFYDRSLKVQQLSDTTLTGKTYPDTKKGGLFIGHELLFGDLAFGLQLGYYVYRPYKTATVYYERIGLKYHLNRHFFGALDLKVHGFAADVVEWRIGYRF